MLRAGEPLSVLAGELTGVHRLVLLGDLVELRQGPVRDALAAASRVLSILARSLPPGAEVVIVPGNHDHHLLDGWLARRAAAAPPAPLGLQSAVDVAPGDPLAVLAASLPGAVVRVFYPGVWLRDDVYLTHGHYLDRHTTVPMFERLGAGGIGRMLRSPIAGAHPAEDYEAILAPIYAWMHALAQWRQTTTGERSSGPSTRVWEALGHGGRKRRRRRGDAIRRIALLLTLRAAIIALNAAGIGPLRTGLSPQQLRSAGLRAFDDVLAALGVRAPYVIFGHTHRAGPLGGDDLAEWVSANGSRLLNSGCWVHEPAFLGVRPELSPYRPGFCVSVQDDRPPQLINLCDASRRGEPGGAAGV